MNSPQWREGGGSWGRGRHGSAAAAHGRARGAHLIQHRIALGSLSLSKQHQASNDVGGHDVEVTEEFSKEVGNF